MRNTWPHYVASVVSFFTFFQQSSLLDSSYCKGNVRWNTSVSVNELQGVWFAVGYFQHNPDFKSYFKNRGFVFECVSVHIADNTFLNPWTQNYTWTEPQWTAFVRSGLADIPDNSSIHRIPQPDERSLRATWNDNGVVHEKVYVYNVNRPWIWKPPKNRNDVADREADFSNAHEEVVSILDHKYGVLVVYVCQEMGVPREFTLALRRSPWPLKRQDWRRLKRLLVVNNLPIPVRKFAVCGCRQIFQSYLVCFTIFVCFIFLYA